MSRPEGHLLAYLAVVDLRRLARYALDLASQPAEGSRRDVLANLVWYQRFLAEVQPQLVHVQHPLERCTYTRRVMRMERRRLPLIVTAHSLFGEHAEKTIYGVMAPNLRAADRVIAVSDHIATQAIALGVDSQRIRIIRSGVDIARFNVGDRCAARHALGIDPATPLVLFVGNLEPRKQVDALLRAMPAVRERVPETILVIVGSGHSAGAQDQTAMLTRLSQELGLSMGLKTDPVRFVGRVADAELLAYYAAADVFALPSSSEAQGIVALEAMACGLAVVASRVGGLVGTIDDGVSGVLVPAGDVPELAAALSALLADPQRRHAMGKAARRRVERDFAWQPAIKATLGVYAELCDAQMTPA